jgi:hypothetical protein
MTAYATLAEFRQRLSGDQPVISGASDETIIEIIAEVSSVLDEEVRVARGQSADWSFLPPSLYGVQVVSISGSASSGNFTLTFGASTSGILDASASAANVQTALDGILGGGNSVVTGAPGGPWTVTFAGTLSGPQPVLVPASAFIPQAVHAVVQEMSSGSAPTVTRRYTGVAGGSALVLIDDAVSVSSVAILDRQGNVAQALVAGTDYLPYPVNSLPITGLRLLSGWYWPSHPGGVEVVLAPGYNPTLRPDVKLAAIQESIRVWRGAQAGENDTLGVTPFGSVVVSKALLQSTLRMIDRYSYGGGYFRGAG